MNTKEKQAKPGPIGRRQFIKSAGVLAGAAALTGSSTLAVGAAPGDSDRLIKNMEDVDTACANDYRRVLERAALREGVRIRSDMTVFASKHNALLVAAPVEGLERIDPARLINGILQGFLYISWSAEGSRPDFYAIKAIAPQGVTLGEIPVVMEFIQGRRVLFTLPGVAMVESLTVPAGAGPDVEVGLAIDTPSTARTCWTCPNGVTICTIHNPEDPMPPE
jgi:hypothetical protein